MLYVARQMSGFICILRIPRIWAARCGKGRSSSGVPVSGSMMREEQFLNVSSQPSIARTEMGTLATIGASASGWVAATASPRSMEIKTDGDVPLSFTTAMRRSELTCSPQSRASLPR